MVSVFCSSTIGRATIDTEYVGFTSVPRILAHKLINTIPTVISYPHQRYIERREERRKITQNDPEELESNKSG